MKPNRKSRVLIVLLTVLILLASSVTVINGAEKHGSITMTYELSDVLFQIYRVGAISDSGVSLIEPYSSYNVNIESENAAMTLAAYIQRDDLPPLDSAHTDEDGNVVFNNLKKGVYLIIGESSVYEGTTYTVMPSMISVPYLSEGNEHWDLRAAVKFEKSTKKVTEISCLKVWENTEGDDHPEVYVQLLRDFKVFDTVKLDKSNNWKYTWKNLDASHQWAVTEESLGEEYKVDISCDGTMYTITNTFNEPPPSTSPTESTEPTEPATSPSVPSTVPSTTNPDTPPSPYIPQTGQLNWPIPILGFIGTALCLIGILIIRIKKDE